jgi:hypothetical protein
MEVNTISAKKKMKKHILLLSVSMILALVLCGAVSAA